MMAFSVRSLSLVDWEIRGAIAGFIVGALAASWFLVRRPLSRWALRALCIPLVVAFVGASIDAHYDYFPTLGSLLGRTAADEVSASAFQRLEHAYLRSFGGRFHFGRRAHTLTAGSLPQRGVVLSFALPGTVSHFPARTGEVYLPPAWFAHPHPKLPVIELLHGSPGSPADWTRGGAADLAADTYAQSHGGFAPILVMPDVNGGGWWNDSECVNGPKGNAETYLTVDVRDAVVHAFGARADGASWGVAGLSEGGSCALQMGLRHPGLFSVVGDFSGDDHPWVHGGLQRLFWGHTAVQLARAERAYDPRVLLASPAAQSPPEPAIVFSAGSSDRVLAGMERLLAEARNDHLAAVLDVYPGGHTFRLWSESFARTLPWMMRGFGGHRSAHALRAHVCICRATAGRIRARFRARTP